MASPFLSEIRIVAFNYAPNGWALCNGQTLPINQNQALFSLMGTYYGGDGVRTFQLPNLQGQTPLMMGTTFAGTYNIGQTGGEMNHSLIASELPPHTHTMPASNTTATTGTPTKATLAQPSAAIGYAYGVPTGSTAMAPQAIANAGQGLPHNNMQPYLVVNFIIALVGIFPSRN